MKVLSHFKPYSEPKAENRLVKKFVAQNSLRI